MNLPTAPTNSTENIRSSVYALIILSRLENFGRKLEAVYTIWGAHSWSPSITGAACFLILEREYSVSASTCWFQADEEKDVVLPYGLYLLLACAILNTEAFWIIALILFARWVSSNFVGVYVVPLSVSSVLRQTTHNFVSKRTLSNLLLWRDLSQIWLCQGSP